MLILRRRELLDFRDTSERVNDSPALRHFTRLYFESVPTYSTLCCYDHLLTDDMLKKINNSIVQGAQDKKVTRSTTMRIDSTAVEADIHYPTDSGLLHDGIKVLSRLATKCRELELTSSEKTRDFTRSANKQVLSILKYARKRTDEGKAEFKNTYKKLIDITKRCVSNAETLVETMAAHVNEQAAVVREKLERMLPIAEQVIDQATRRGLKDEKIPSDEKILSIFQSGL